MHLSFQLLLLLSHAVLQVFHDVAYKAKSREDLLAGIDEFLDKVISVCCIIVL